MASCSEMGFEMIKNSLIPIEKRTQAKKGQDDEENILINHRKSGLKIFLKDPVPHR